VRIDLGIMAQNRHTEDNDSGHPCIRWDSICPPINDNSCSIDLKGAHSIVVYRLSRKRAHHIGAEEKPHHEVVPARRETESTEGLVWRLQ